MCARRTAGFARVYDLAERVLPATLDTTNPGAEAAAIHLMRRAIGAMGIAAGREAADYFHVEAGAWRPALAALREAGEIVEVSVEGWHEVAYALPAALAGSLRQPRHRPAFLSPFDNLIWLRSRTERLFNFHYRIEIYVPEPQRRYGYYVLPILEGERLVGRLDPKLYREEGRLEIRQVWWEPGVRPSKARDLRLEAAVERLARFTGAETWTL
jgi:hypothetical protein